MSSLGGITAGPGAEHQKKISAIVLKNGLMRVVSNVDANYPDRLEVYVGPASQWASRENDPTLRTFLRRWLARLDRDAARLERLNRKKKGAQKWVEPSDSLAICRSGRKANRRRNGGAGS